jgi:lipoprotein-anchoring transpeptidase ErfK/SrfK
MAERPNLVYQVFAGPNPRFERRVVQIKTAELPGTIIIDTNTRLLYYLEEQWLAIEYGVGVGRQGFEWSGVANVKSMTEWPTWTPPAEMIARDPSLAKYANGMPGGPDNPLGARALYLFANGADTYYRIHGTNHPETIGQAVSSGCIRMRNDDAIDLYQRVALGAKVIVL